MNSFFNDKEKRIEPAPTRDVSIHHAMAGRRGNMMAYWVSRISSARETTDVDFPFFFLFGGLGYIAGRYVVLRSTVGLLSTRVDPTL